MTPFTRTLMRPETLHIPDGFLSLPTAVILWLASILFIRIAVRKIDREDLERSIPLMGIMAAFIFAGQMINFPVAGGTSGHLLGGVLAAVTLGPWAGILVMTTVIGVQALIFQDGGLLALGANLFNMGILTVIVGTGVHALTRGRPMRTRLAAAGIAAWISVIAGAVAAALELWLSGTAALGLVMMVMAGVHALIGLGEALITVGALAFIARSRPDLLDAESDQQRKAWIAPGLAVTAGVLLLAPVASAFPDGLERVAAELGFIGSAQEPPIGLLPGYTIPGLGDTAVSTVAAGLAGIFLLLALFLLVGRLRRGRSDRRS